MSKVTSWTPSSPEAITLPGAARELCSWLSLEKGNPVCGGSGDPRSMHGVTWKSACLPLVLSIPVVHGSSSLACQDTLGWGGGRSCPLLFQGLALPPHTCSASLSP